MYDARKELCRQVNLRAILAGGRIVNYHKYANELTPSQYLDKVQRREIYDPILTFQLANDFSVKRLLGKYLPEDKSHAALLHCWSGITFCTSLQITF